MEYKAIPLGQRPMSGYGEVSACPVGLDIQGQMETERVGELDINITTRQAAEMTRPVRRRQLAQARPTNLGMACRVYGHVTG